MEKRGFCNSMYVAELRYIQSIHESHDRQGPDGLVGRFLPLLRRWHCEWLSHSKLSALQTDPFYYYLLARTKYYDQLLREAVAQDIRQIVNIGCGTDTRSYRFQEELLKQQVRVAECDQAPAIAVKQRMVQRLGSHPHVSFLSIDLNDVASWNSLQEWLGINHPAATLVMMEGVSPYIESTTFTQFLTMLGRTLPQGSWVAYDFKVKGICDAFGRIGTVQTPFRLTKEIQDIRSFHTSCGFHIDSIEDSETLSTRLVPRLESSQGHMLCHEDVLVRLSK